MEQGHKMEPMSFTITLSQHRPAQNQSRESGHVEILSQGASFWSLGENLKPIYEHFNILAYLSPSVKVELNEERKFRYFGKTIMGYLFSINTTKMPFCVFEVHRDQYKQISNQNEPKKELNIIYHFTNDKDQYSWPQIDEEIKLREDECRKIEKEMKEVRVQFRTERRQRKQGQVQKEEEVIVIDVKDTCGWIASHVYPVYYENREKFGRISERRRMTRRWNYADPELNQALKNQREKKIELPALYMLPPTSTDLEYFYLEPKSQREKSIKGEHIALALQGGGCKGVAYIGAYKAILDCYKGRDIPIRTVIGSSAGGIVGLAICCGVEPSGIVELCEQYLSQVTAERTYGTLQEAQKGEAMVKYYFKILEKACQNYNILDADLLKRIKMVLQDKEILDYAEKWILQKSGFSENTNLASLFRYNDGSRNLAGLLNSKLMTGGKVKQLGRKCLQKLNIKDRFYPHIDTQEDDKRWEDKITMKQLYQVTGIQFTCTCVDLTNHILRFFNHKTTPNLPVIYAVKMTSAFPVAFEATYWKEEWGKYYIHYEKMRSEIDLRGCKFTDGGMLANFPIDCIDNEDMRPMYFSHCSNRQLKVVKEPYEESAEKYNGLWQQPVQKGRIIYGVGLKECKDFFLENGDKNKNGSLLQNIQYWKKIIEKTLKIAGLKNVFSFVGQKLVPNDSYLSKIVRFFYRPQQQFRRSSQIDLLGELRKIPLIDFVFNLLVTYTSTKDKLAEESFRHQIYEIVPSQSVQAYIMDRQGAMENVQNQIDSLKADIQQIRLKRESKIGVLKSNLQYIRTQNPQTQQQILELRSKLDLILSNLMFNLLYFYSERRGNNLYNQHFIKLLEKVEQAFKRIHWKEQVMYDERETPLAQKIKEMVRFKASLQIRHKYIYQQILESQDKMWRHYFNRVFFQLQLMRNSRLFVLSNISNDYQAIKRISEQAQRLIEQIFRDRVKETFKSKNGGMAQFFVPEEYLADQHNREIKKLQNIQNLLNYPQNFKKIKSFLDEQATMLEELTEYNRGSFNPFSLTPYNRLNLLSLIKQIQTYCTKNQEEQSFQGYCDSLRPLQDLGNNKNVERVISIVNNIRTQLNQNVINKVFNNKELLDTLIDLPRNIMTLRIKDIEKIKKTVSEFKSCIDLIIALESYKKRQGLISYIKSSTEQYIQQQTKNIDVASDSCKKRQGLTSSIQKRLTKQQQNEELIYGFHIVMESAPLAEIYLFDILEILKCFRVDMGKESYLQKNNLPVTSITLSNIHSIAGVLYASDLQVQKMRKYVNQIKDLTYENKSDFIERIQRKLNSDDWAKKSPTFLKDITAQYLKQAQEEDIFKKTQEKLKSTSQWKQFNHQMKDVERDAETEKEKLISMIQQSLDCVMEEIYRTDQDVQVRDKLEMVARSLALSQKQVDSQKNAMTSIVSFVNILAQKYVELFKIAVESSQYVAEELVTSISRGEKKDAWKGIFLGQIHTSFKIKKMVQDIMQELNLSKNTTLQQFYQASSKKITLNFSVITTQSRHIEIYNHCTRPYMPVWAAVVATSSAMQFFKPLTDKKQWRYQLKNDIEERIIKKNFEQLSPSTNHLYSADCIRRLPVDLLKNDKMSQKINQHCQTIKKRQIFLTFDFNTNIDYAKSLKKSQQNKRIRIQNIDARDVMNLYVLGLKSQDVLTIPLVQKVYKQVQSYVDSHDELIMNLYKKELILLPIRLGVVDFHKMCVPANGKNALGEKSNDSVMQSYFLMKEKIENFEAIKSMDKEKNSKKLYFRLESVKNKQQYQNDQLMVRFLSKLVPHKHFRQDYNLYYQKIGKNGENYFQKIEQEYLPLKNRQMLTIKIEYVEIGSSNCCSRIFVLNFGNFYVKGQFGFVYCLQYSIFKHEQRLEPQSCLTPNFQDDYMLRDADKNDKDLKLIIKATLKQEDAQFKFQRPMCQKFHPIQVRKESKSFPFYQKIVKDRNVAEFVCQECQPPNQFKLSQKYQIKLYETNKIKCTLDHPIDVVSRLSDYPGDFQFVICDRCSRNTPRSYFKDAICKVDLCYDCVIEMIKNQA